MYIHDFVSNCNTLLPEYETYLHVHCLQVEFSDTDHFNLQNTVI